MRPTRYARTTHCDPCLPRLTAARSGANSTRRTGVACWNDLSTSEALFTRPTACASCKHRHRTSTRQLRATQNNFTAMWTGVEDHVPFSLSCDSQDAPAARQNLLIEAWLRDLILSAALAPPQPLPAERSGTKRKRPQHSPVLGEMDRNVRKIPTAGLAIDIEMGEASAPKTPTLSPTKPKIAPGDCKGRDKTKRGQREDNGVYSRIGPLTYKPLLRKSHSG